MEITIRKAIPEDANKIIEMFNKLDKELEFLLLDFNEKKITENDEVIFIKNFNDSKNNLFLVTEINKRIIGTLTFIRENYKKKFHSGNIGIVILKEYWGQKIGTQMLENAINFAKTIGVKKINLEVFSNNKRAILFYQKNKFQIEGKIINGILNEGKYENIILMGREIN